MVTTKKKQKIIKDTQIHDADTGSLDVTIALYSEKISELAEHLKVHKKDHHSRRGLIGLVAKRRGLLAQLKKDEPERYEKLIKKLGLKK